MKVNEYIRGNDVVLIVDPDTPRRKWLLGKVLEIFCGPEKRLRVAKVVLDYLDI